jgi:universal stress protein A
MTTFENILVPMDFAAHSSEALRVAGDIALRYSAALTLIYVYEQVDYALPEGYVLYTPEQVQRMTAEFQKRLSLAQQQVEQQGVQRVRSLVLQGPVALEIVDYAKTQNMDLIVMGTHGRTGIKHVLMGSVAERVLRMAPCPVLTVKAREKAAA